MTGHIKDLKIRSDEQDKTTILVTLPSNPTFGVNPKILMTRVFELLDVDPVSLKITRKYMLDENFERFV